MQYDEQLIRDLYQDFRKEEILDIADELGVKFDISDRTKVIIGKILDFVSEHKPKFAKLSDEAAEFLVAAEICDEDGEYLDSFENKKIQSVEETKTVSNDDEVKLPECYGKADRDDPACMICKLLSDCSDERIRSRPICFGKLYDSNSEDCKLCIEEEFCNKMMMEK